MAFVGLAPNKRHLAKPNGQPFFVMGANYEGYFDRAWRMWDDGKFDPTLIAHDFRKMAEAGLNVVRLFVLPALENELRANNFSKLDRALQIAADHDQLVLLTFNDSHRLNLAEVVALDVKIARRYQDDPVILGWDLENEPRFYNFAAAIYPPSQPSPLQTNTLVNHYGARVSQQEAITRQNQGRIPAHLNPQYAFYYINALQYFIEFANDADQWGAQSGKTVVDYMYSHDSAKWHKLIEALNGAVAAWLEARHTPVRQADPNHLITVGYNWLHLAGLPANRKLDFQQFHHYSTASLSQLNHTFQALTSLQTAFPHHPILLGEFGYSNQSASSSAASRPVPETVTALFEAAALAYLRANQYAGGLKWMLNDVDTNTNPYEANFGIYRQGDHPKPIRDLLARFSQKWPPPPGEGQLKIIQDPIGLAMRFDLDNQIMLSGGIFQDETFSWQSEGAAHCFIDLEPGSMTLQAQGKGLFAVDPWEVISDWQLERRAILYQLINHTPVEQKTFPPVERVSWEVLPNITYRLMMAKAPATLPSGEEPGLIPNPGEHVVLLADANQTLALALPYLRKFAPDITFTPQQVAGRWSYVTVIAAQAQISAEILQEIKASGAQIVERIAGDVAGILNDLIARNRRFLLAELTNPPADSPTDPVEPPADIQIYAVQPGDTLSKIALKFYGKSSLWPFIFEANRDVLDNPSLVRPGVQLKIPQNPA